VPGHWVTLPLRFDGAVRAALACLPIEMKRN